MTKIIEEFEDVIVEQDDYGTYCFVSNNGSTSQGAMRELYREILRLRSELDQKRLEPEDQE